MNPIRTADLRIITNDRTVVEAIRNLKVYKMKLIICIDDRGGYSFNHRRVSFDRIQISHMFQKVKEAKGTLFYNRYTEKNIYRDEINAAAEAGKEYEFRMETGAEFLKKACEADGYAFVENVALKGYYSELTEVMLYRFNRTYPFDLQFPEKILEGFILVEEEEFEGSSHEQMNYQRYILKSVSGKDGQNE